MNATKPVVRLFDQILAEIERTGVQTNRCKLVVKASLATLSTGDVMCLTQNFEQAVFLHAWGSTIQSFAIYEPPQPETLTPWNI